MLKIFSREHPTGSVPESGIACTETLFAGGISKRRGVQVIEGVPNAGRMAGSGDTIGIGVTFKGDCDAA